MRKAFFLIMTLLLWTAAAQAQEAAGTQSAEPLEADIRVGGSFVQKRRTPAWRPSTITSIRPGPGP